MRLELIDRTVKSNSFDVPASLLNKYLDSVVADYKSNGENVDENTVRQQYRPVGENLIRWNFLYHEIAAAEKIMVTPEDRMKWVHDFAVSHNLPVERAREALGKSGRQSDIDESIIEAKVLEHIIDNSEIIEDSK